MVMARFEGGLRGKLACIVRGGKKEGALRSETGVLTLDQGRRPQGPLEVV